MSWRVPIRRAAELVDLDDDDLLDGYRSGSDGDPEPGDNRSFSFWHGWRNGARDHGHIEGDEAMAELAHDVIVTGYFRKKASA